MPNPFQSFDPFASSPVAAASKTDANTNTPSGSPFDNFSFTAPTSSNASTDWQQSARSVMTNGSKFLSKAASSNMSLVESTALTQYLRVVPYRSPISTLQSNCSSGLYIAHSSAPQSLWTNHGNSSTYLIVKLNESCCTSSTSVESVLKWNKLRGKNNAAVNELNRFDTLSLSEDDGAVRTGSLRSGSSDIQPSISGTASNARGRQKGLNFFKNISQKANAAISHGVTQIAIKADAGRNPDEVCVGLHYCSGQNISVVNAAFGNAIGTSGEAAVSNVCLSKTEWMALSTSHEGHGRGVDGVLDINSLFTIPLCLPDLTFLSACAAGANGPGVRGHENGVRLVVRLYIRSSSAFLKAVANTGLKGEYCIGEAVVLLESILHLVGRGVESNATGFGTNTSGEEDRVGGFSLPFTAGMLADTTFASQDDSPAALKIMATTRIKFNLPCTYGWTLCDSVSSVPNMSDCQNWIRMFNMSLDQAYVFPLRHHHYLLNNNPGGGVQSMNDAVLLANERAVESTLVLPLATACSLLFSGAATKSHQLAIAAAQRNRRVEAIYPPSDGSKESVIASALTEGCAEVEIGVIALVMLGESANAPYLNACGLAWAPGMESVPRVSTTLMFQPPCTVFEEELAQGSLPLLDEAAGKAYIQDGSGTGAISVTFCPRLLTSADELLPGVAGTRPNGKYVGSVRFEVQAGFESSNPVTNVVDNIVGITSGTAVEGNLLLDSYIDSTMRTSEKVPVMVPAVDANSGRRLGTFVTLLRMKSTGLNNRSDVAGGESSSGLVSIVGLDTLTEQSGLAPCIDHDSPVTNNCADAAGVRRCQVATMGSFLTTQYLHHKVTSVRACDASVFTERYKQYNNSLLSCTSPQAIVKDDSGVQLHERRVPRAFRPSCSRGDKLLTGIGFNVHVQSLALDVLQEGQPSTAVGVTQSITHGAPADHARGFGVTQPSEESNKEDGSAPRGGLRRLETKRLQFAKDLEDAVTGLIGSVGTHFKSRAKVTAGRQQAGVKLSRHVPPNIPSISYYQSKAIECAQKLNSLTWDVAVRRANCFSQALGIAVTSYMASISDGGPAREHSNIWAKHGYLVTFEGLLSAVGKELGMIEDASVAISMLRMVNVVLIDDGQDPHFTQHLNRQSQLQRVPVPHSPYVRWVHLFPITHQGSHSKTQYRLEIGLYSNYYHSRVPDPLKNGTSVRFFPILFQMGVDIRQWGANAGRNVQSQIKDKKHRGSVDGLVATEQNSAAVEAEGNEPMGNCCLLDDGDEDDEGGIADNEILFNLNVDGYRKLNSYAHSVMPATVGVTHEISPVPVFDTLEQPTQPLPQHPHLCMLSEAIKASAGKMEHGVLDRAASLCQQFGGGSTVFCKSGKDRTAMQVTFKQAQFVQRYLDRKEQTATLEDTKVSSDCVFSKSTIMRIHGNRILICEKNAGEPKFAFNPLQRKFMPEMLRPEASLCQWSKPET